MPAQPQAHSFNGSTCGAEIGAEEEARVAGDGSGAQRQAMLLALGDRQAVIVRPDAADQDGIAVEDQVMGRDRRRRGSPSTP